MYKHNANYSERKYQQKWQRFRFGLGLQQFLVRPWLNALWIIPILVGLLLWKFKNFYLSVFTAPDMMRVLVENCLIFAVILIPLIIVGVIFLKVGEWTARPVENKLMVCFDAKHLRAGHPILVSKRRGKNRKVTVWHIFSYIPMQIWRERQNYIEDVFFVRLTKDIQYGDKPNIVVLEMVKGRKSTSKGVIYDETI